MKHITMIFAMLIALTTSLAIAQTVPLKQWDVRFGGSKDDALRSLQQTADGGYILGGFSDSKISGDKTQASQGGIDCWLVKTDGNGVKQWDARFGGSKDDYLLSLQKTADGGYILGGYSNSEISGDKTQASQGGVDYWMVKTDVNGVKQWDARFGGSKDDYLFTLQQTADGGYILGGQSLSGISGDKTQTNQGDYDYWIVKTDANGVKQWDAGFGGSSNDYLYSLQQTADGGYILGGLSSSGISGDKTQASQGFGDYWIVKTDANGVKQWDARFGGDGGELLAALQQTADGGYILGGFSSSGISGDRTQESQGWYDYWIVKTDANGVKQWDKRFGGIGADLLYSLQQTSDGGYMLGGYSDSEISGDITQANQGINDYWIVKTDANGVKQWDARFGGGDYDQLYSLQQTADEGYILGGYSSSGISGDKTQASQGGNDYWIVKLASECNGGSTVYADADGDGYGDIANSLFVADCIVPDGYVYDNSDCNDADVSVHPGVCDANNGDGVDDNCDGIIDDGYGATTYYTDADGDGYGAGTAISLCSNPGAGYSTDNTDCNDADAGIHPGATEITNGTDDNCNGIIDDVLQPGLIAYYPFNGNAHDETGNGYNGAVSGATLSDDRFGNPMSAYSFDGVNDKIVIGQEPNFPSWDTYAVSLWFLSDGGGDQGQGYGQKVLSKAQFFTDFHLSVGNNDQDGNLIWWSAQGGFNSVSATDQDYRDNQWHHVVLNKNSPKKGEIWVDGVLQASSTTLQKVINSEDLVIGFTTHSDGYQQKYFSGKIDDIRFYDRVLSPTEISELFTEGGDSIVCAVPSNLSVKNITSSSAKLKWDAVAGAEGYTVRYKVASNEWKYGTTFNNAKQLNGLLPNTVYKWEVKTFCHVDPPRVKSDWSSKQEFTTGSLRMGDESLEQISFQIYPNPAEALTTIQFALTHSSHISIKVYDMSGKEIATLLDVDVEQGEHSLLLKANNFSKGVYMLQMICASGIENQKLIVQ